MSSEYGLDFAERFAAAMSKALERALHDVQALDGAPLNLMLSFRRATLPEVIVRSPLRATLPALHVAINGPLVRLVACTTDGGEALERLWFAWLRESGYRCVRSEMRRCQMLLAERAASEQLGGLYTQNRAIMVQGRPDVELLAGGEVWAREIALAVQQFFHACLDVDATFDAQKSGFLW